MLKVFVSYAHADRAMRAALETHLSLLKRQMLVELWTDCEIKPGDEIGPAIRKALDQADIVLLLVSADFLASDYCIEVELKRAIERHEAGRARVIPVILRPCDWHSAPFGQFMALPEDGQPVSTASDRDAALFQVAKGLRRIIEGGQKAPDALSPTVRPKRTAATPAQRSGTALRAHVPKSFTDRDRDEFLEAAFHHITGVFEASLERLEAENDHCTTRFKPRADSEFIATIYKDGTTVAECKVWYESRGLTGCGLAFSYDPSSQGSFNEQMRVEEAEGTLRLKPLGMALHGRASDHLDPQGAAEYLWAMLVERLRWSS